jgi:hypothetical protein
MSGARQWYVYTHEANGKVFYVGYGGPNRPYDRARTMRWSAHARQHGAYEIKIHARTGDLAEAQRIERELISAYRPPGNAKRGIGCAKMIPALIRDAAAMVASVDDWRRLQPDMPNRAEAIRRLVAIGLRADPPTQRLTPVKGKPEPKK